MKKKIILFSIACASLLLAACHKQTEKKSDQPTIITTIYPMYEFTKEIVGSEAKVELLIPAGTEPHDYEPSAKDIAKMQQAKTIIYDDPNMETWISKTQKSLQDSKVNFIQSTKEMILLPGTQETHEHDHGKDDHHHDFDPHVWLAPSLAKKQVQTITKELSKQYPKLQKKFATNSQKYLAKLTQLDQEYQKQLSQLPQKHFVTQHSAFQYLAVEYGLKQIPIAGINPEEEPSASKLAELKKLVKQYEVQTIFFEENAQDKIARTLAKEANVKLAVLNPLEGLTNSQIEKGENYLTVMRQNLQALVKAGSKQPSTKQENTQDKPKTVYNGYFNDDQIKNRSLKDWQGSWQSVYPLVAKGELDQVFHYKAKLNPKKTAEGYRAYYEKGYRTDVKQIEIQGDTFTFTFDDGSKQSSDYRYVGYKVLNYQAGNRGVRYLFEAKDSQTKAFKYLQFSDHAISPQKAGHFHLYFGNESQEALLNELENWPTYYPSQLSAHEIAQEMVAH
ncbi:MAG TPA: ZinT/AdcA family metal-binding protein [Candidatus Enterococcus stercoripullorum]|nr:ZinT/AdcA family metal-binding protein [Candidatus Enterococcus stercoripullorum]